MIGNHRPVLVPGGCKCTLLLGRPALAAYTAPLLPQFRRCQAADAAPDFGVVLPQRGRRGGVLGGCWRSGKEAVDWNAGHP